MNELIARLVVLMKSNTILSFSLSFAQFGASIINKALSIQASSPLFIIIIIIMASQIFFSSVSLCCPSYLHMFLSHHVDVLIVRLLKLIERDNKIQDLTN